MCDVSSVLNLGRGRFMSYTPTGKRATRAGPVHAHKPHPSHLCENLTTRHQQTLFTEAEKRHFSLGLMWTVPLTTAHARVPCMHTHTLTSRNSSTNCPLLSMAHSREDSRSASTALTQRKFHGEAREQSTLSQTDSASACAHVHTRTCVHLVPTHARAQKCTGTVPTTHPLHSAAALERECC